MINKHLGSLNIARVVCFIRRNQYRRISFTLDGQRQSKIVVSIGRGISELCELIRISVFFFTCFVDLASSA